MKAEKPAVGIMKKYDGYSAKQYSVDCVCSDPNHNHDVWVEAIDHDISVSIYATVKSDWNKNRFKYIWKLLTKGYIELETELLMNEQQTLNYAEALKTAVNDVANFKKNQKNKNIC